MGWLSGSEQRRHDEAQARVTRLVESGEVAEAETVARAALRRIRTDTLRTSLLTGVVAGVLGAGSRPELLPDAVASLLSEADGDLERGLRARAGRALGRALTIACDRTIHLQSVSSPLAENPALFFDALRGSATARAARAPRGRDARAEPERRPGPTRVLIVTRKNANFLGQLQEHLDASSRFEARFLDLAEHEHIMKGLRAPVAMATQILTAAPKAAQRLESAFRAELEWADVLFVEWCTAHAALLNLVDPRSTRVVLRLHSYEAFSPWPHLLDFTRIDDLLSVSDHLRDLVADAIPGVQETAGLRMPVIPPGLPLQKYVRPKADEARFTVGLVGWRQVAKDPRWALEVVRELRQLDERYRLLLIGDDFDADVSAATRAYGARLFTELTELEQAGTVRRYGRTDDVPGALTEVGVILSSSVRESFHAGLVEGAASGAVPVVRDWPFFAGRRAGARTLFPGEWVVETPQQAASRVLEATRDVDAWRRGGEAASLHALATWDWDVVKSHYDRLLSR